jgi:DNA-binding LytR/AlgR family response regulator
LQSNEPAPAAMSKKANYDDVIYVIVDGALKCRSAFVEVTAEGNYSYIFYADKPRALVSKTLQEWEELLPEKYFVRIHRSTIINFAHVEKVKKRKNYSQEVFVKGIEKPFMMSRRYATKLKHLAS